MKQQTIFNKMALAGVLGSVVVVMSFSGCATNGDSIDRIFGILGNVGSGDRTGGRSAVQSEYLYYPEYDLYYNRNTREFLSVENNRWVARTNPRNVSANRVFATRAVSLDGYDSPQHHRNIYYQQNRYESGRPAADPNRGWNTSDGRVYR